MASFTQRDLDTVAKAILGEVGANATPQEMYSIAAVIANRAADPGYASRYGTSLADQATAHSKGGTYQFTAFSPSDGNSGVRVGSGSAYDKAKEAARKLLTGEVPDPTGGALNYWAPAAMIAQGAGDARGTPYWGNKQLDAGLASRVGRHVFINHDQPFRQTLTDTTIPGFERQPSAYVPGHAPQPDDYRDPNRGKLPIVPELGPPPSNMNLVGFPDAPGSQGPSETAQQARARLAQLSQNQRDASYDPTTSPSAMTPGNVAMPSYFGAEFAQTPLAPMMPQAPQVASYDPLSSVRAPFGFAPPTMAGVGPTAPPTTLPSYFGAAFSPGSLTPQAPASQGLQAFPELSKAFQEAIKPPVSRAPQVSNPGGVSGLTSLGLPSLYQQNKPLGNTWNVLANSGMPSVSQPQPQSYDPLSSVRTPQVPQSTATSGQSYDPLSSISAPRAAPYGFDAPSAPTRSASGYDPLSSIRSLPLAQGEGSYSTPALAPSPTYQTQTSYQNVPNPALDSARKALADARARAANYDATPMSDFRAAPISLSGSVDGGLGAGASAAGGVNLQALVAAAQKRLAALPATIQVPTTVRKLVPQVPQQQPAYDPLSSVRNGGGNPFLNAGMTYLGNAPSGAGQYTNGLSINGVQQVFAGNAPSNALGGMGYGSGSGGGLLSSIGKALGLS